MKVKRLTKPYGYLLVEHPGFEFRCRLPIKNAFDFSLVASVYDRPDILKSNTLEDRDLLVVYAPENDIDKRRRHVLHFAITPTHLLEDCIRDNGEDVLKNVDKLFGKFDYLEKSGVDLNINPSRYGQLLVTLEAIKSGTVSRSEKSKISQELVCNASLFSSQKKQLVEQINRDYEK